MGMMPTMQGDRSGSSHAASLVHTSAVLLGTENIAFHHGPAARGEREHQGAEGPDGTRVGAQVGHGTRAWLPWVQLPQACLHVCP